MLAGPGVRLCLRQVTPGLKVCGFATLRGAPGSQEKSSSEPVFQYVGEHKKPTHKVFVWGFSFTGALGIPSFVVPDSGRKKPRKYQLTPYRLETAEQVNPGALKPAGGLERSVAPNSITLGRLVFFSGAQSWSSRATICMF